MEPGIIALIVSISSIVCCCLFCCCCCCKAQLDPNGETYSPSRLTQIMFVKNPTNYEELTIDNKYEGDLKILVVCTEESGLPMANGKIFNTGNHPTETLVPMLHMQNAGFDFDIATLSGKPALFEMWAFPNKDTNVNVLYEVIKPKMENPLVLDDIDLENFSSKYAGIFIPGGHGAVIGLPQSKKLGEILTYVHEKQIPTISLCHGPASFVSPQENIYDGYKMCVFPDAFDNYTPMVGYLPGYMNWFVCHELEERGITIVNSSPNDEVTRDRETITGASPDASHNLGVLAVPILLEYCSSLSAGNKKRDSSGLTEM